MGLFRPYEQGKHEPAGKVRTSTVEVEETGDAATSATRTPASSPQTRTAGSAAGSGAGAATAPKLRRKNGPTRSRAEAEAERMERLHPQLTPREQRRRSRSLDRIERQRRMEAIESRPERALLRDYIDSRWTFAEFVLPVAIVIMAVSLGGAQYAIIAMGTSIAMLVVFALLVVNFVWMWYGFRSELRERQPNASTKGLVMIMVNRMLSIRRFRNPAPRIPRGGEY